MHNLCSLCTIGAVGSALVLCTEGPGFEPLMVHSHTHTHVQFLNNNNNKLCRISLVGQDSWLSPGRHEFDSRMRYIFLLSKKQMHNIYAVCINVKQVELLWRNWIARWTSNPTVAGSNPVKSEYIFLCMCVHNYKHITKYPRWCSW